VGWLPIRRRSGPLDVATGTGEAALAGSRVRGRRLDVPGPRTVFLVYPTT
jgi:hypothetical protein